MCFVTDCRRLGSWTPVSDDEHFVVRGISHRIILCTCSAFCILTPSTRRPCRSTRLPGFTVLDQGSPSTRLLLLVHPRYCLLHSISPTNTGSKHASGSLTPLSTAGQPALPTRPHMLLQQLDVLQVLQPRHSVQDSVQDEVNRWAGMLWPCAVLCSCFCTQLCCLQYGCVHGADKQHCQ